jgi:hypothetical protein
LKNSRLLAGIGEGDIGAEANHAQAGGDTLVAAEAETGLQFALERGGKENNEEVGRSIEGDGDAPENDKLEKNMALGWGDELGNEGEEEEGGLGIENFRKDALAEGTLRGRGRIDDKLCVAGADHANAEPDEVGGASVLDGVKGDGGGGKNRRDAESSGEDVAESAEKRAEGGEDALAAAARETASENVENAGAGSDGQDECSNEKEQKAMQFNHSKMISAWRAVRKGARTGGESTEKGDWNMMARRGEGKKTVFPRS